ncbi:hypothetical protein FRC03_004704 [Tulasnella sp. 419]|nr:hypothetical protein FRC03_004704 [Tulasnella sp. 419]
MAPFVLKFKGNKSFSPFSNLSDSDSLTRTWKVCTKVAAHLEQGQRLENLSWRLWHLQSLIVDDNAKSKREFKKLSKNMGERLDKDKGRSIEELQAPEFHRTESANKLKRRAEEKERAGRGTGMKAMTFTFPADPTTNKTPGAITANTQPKKHSINNSRLHHAKEDHFDHDHSQLDDTSMDTSGNGNIPERLVIDTNFATSPVENASTPTSSSIVQPNPASEADSAPSFRGHWRSHNASISSVSSSIYQSNFNSPPSPADTSTSTAFPRTDYVPQPGPELILHTGKEQSNVIRFPALFDSSFEPTVLLCPAPSVAPTLSYGDSIGFTGYTSSSRHANSFGITRPTFEFPLDELMNTDTGESDADTNDGLGGSAGMNGWATDDGKSIAGLSNSVSSLTSLSIPTPVSASISMASFSNLQIGANVDAMQGVQSNSPYEVHGSQNIDIDLDGDELSNKHSPPLVPSQSAPASPAIFAMSSASPAVFTQANVASGGATPGGNKNEVNGPGTFAPPPPLTLPKGALLPGPSPTNTPSPPAPAPPAPTHRIPRRYSTTNAPPLSSEGGAKRSRQLSATAAPRSIRGLEKGAGTSGGDKGGVGTGVKTECANCGANSTPLWRRGLNDELNCNACGLFAKLHKRPRPKTLRTGSGSGNTGEGGTRSTGWTNGKTGDGEAGEPVSCYNCATIATPLWRKDEDGRTLCNACGLYLKLHGEKRPSSMKSDVIRKRSRHEVRRGTTGSSSSATPSASPGASRRTSPTPPNSSQNVSGGNSSPPQQQQQGHSPYDPSNGSYDFGNSPQGGHGIGVGQDGNTGADLMGMNHHLVVDGGVDPALGGMTFSPGATYTETLYPGPLSLHYYQTHYALSSPDHMQQQQQAQQQQHHTTQQQTPSSVSSQLNRSPDLSDGGSAGGGGGGGGPMYGPSNGPNSASEPSSAASSIWDTSFQLGSYMYHPQQQQQQQQQAHHHSQQMHQSHHHQQQSQHQPHQQQQHHHGHHGHSASFGGFGANDAYGGSGLDALGFNIHPPMLPFWNPADITGTKTKMEPSDGLDGFGFGMH